MTDDLYTKLICALTHNYGACDICKNCGKDCSEARMNIIKQLAKEEGKELPWVDSK